MNIPFIASVLQRISDDKDGRWIFSARTDMGGDVTATIEKSGGKVKFEITERDAASGNRATIAAGQGTVSQDGAVEFSPEDQNDAQVFAETLRVVNAKVDEGEIVIQERQP